MNKARTAYMVVFVLVLGAIFATEVHVPPGFPFGSKATTATGPCELRERVERYRLLHPCRD